MAKLKVLELFAGIGAFSKSLERLKIDHEIVDAVEIDKYAIKSFNAIHGTNFEPQDITTWNKDIEVDIIMHGSPCQDFSLAGLGKGGDKNSGTRSSLMYETLRIVEKLKPKYVIWENVKNLLSKKHKHNFDAYLQAMSDLGYSNKYKVLNAKDFGIPQNRERIFTVSIRAGLDNSFVFPDAKPLKKKLRDFLEKNPDERFYLSDEQISSFVVSGNKKVCNSGMVGKVEAFNGYDIIKRVYGIDGESPTINTCQGGHREVKIMAEVPIRNATNKGYDIACDGDAIDFSFPHSTTKRGRVGHKMARTIKTVDDQGVLDGYSIRKLTPQECWRLMGFDIKDFQKAKKVGMSNSQLYKQAGNSIVVNVLEAISKNLLKPKTGNQQANKIP